MKKGIVILIVCLCVVISVGLVSFFIITYKNKSTTNKIISSDDFSINILELGSKNNGDSIYIKYKDIDILIDAGAEEKSSISISDFINKNSNDKVLDYVITTHYDKDHIAAFVGNKTYKGIFDEYEIKNLIDNKNTSKKTNVYTNYVLKRDELVKKGTNHFFVDKLFLDNDMYYRITLDNGVYLDILYNYYYFIKNESDENNYSICTLFTYNNYKALLTGDLEQKGESMLVTKYANTDIIKNVDLFKAGHHGSYTASSEDLLALVNPKNVVVSCVAFSTEYSRNYKSIFPSYDATKRILKKTNNMYITSLYDYKTDSYGSYNGTISCVFSGSNFNINCQNNNISFPESEYFKEEIYILDNNVCDTNKIYYTKDTIGAILVKRREI